MRNSKPYNSLEAELRETQLRLEEAEETLRAIRNNEVDALVIDGPEGQQVFTLQTAEQPYRILMETMSEGTATLAFDGTILYCNSHLSQLIGLPLNKIIGESLYDFVISRNSRSLEAMLSELRREGFREEFLLKTADGREVPVSISARSLMVNDTEAFCVVAADLTDQKRIQEHLEKAQALLEEKIAERTSELRQTNVALQSEIAERKHAEERMLRQTALLEGINCVFREAITRGSEEELAAVCLSVAEELTESRMGFIGEIHSDGRLYNITISNPAWDLCVIPDRNGHSGSLGAFEIHGLYGHVLMNNRSLLTNDPVSHPEFVGLPVGHPPLTAFLGVPMTENGRALGLIAVGNRDGGYTPEHRETLEALAPAIVQALLRKRAEDAVHQSRDELELRVQERSEDLQKAYDKLREETDEREAIQDQLRQAQKLEALGTFTGGIAHDFNNILAAMIGFTELALDGLEERSKVRHHLDRIFMAGLRGRDLIKQMMAFSRKTPHEKKPLRLSDMIKETMRIIRPSIPSTVDITVNIKRESGMILADPIQIQQVLINLATNAGYAMRQRGGTLDIELDDFSVSRKVVAPHEIKPGLYMLLRVKDSGEGMTADVLSKIYDPFFTTKERGEGTGLGLSVVHGIVKECDGYIIAESKPGEGTSFSLYFPKIEEQGRAEETTAAAIPTGHERILFIDDEEAIVEIGQEVLSELGYRVESKTSSREALAVFRLDPSRFDLVMSDQTMPDMTGIDLTREVLAIRPDIPVILCTGFSHMVNEESAKEAGVKAFAMKPLTKREIAVTIRKVLDGCI